MTKTLKEDALKNFKNSLLKMKLIKFFVEVSTIFSLASFNLPDIYHMFSPNA